MGTVIGDGRTTPTNATIRSTKRGAKGGKRGKSVVHHLTMVNTDGNVRDEIENSDEEFMATTEHNFKWRIRLPKDHFEKILEAACPHHPYPIKHKLRDCTMMKRFMTSGAPPGGDEPASNSRGRGTMLVPGEVSYPGSKKQNRSLYTCVQDV
jgi:hypothetical protein